MKTALFIALLLGLAACSGGGGFASNSKCLPPVDWASCH